MKSARVDIKVDKIFDSIVVRLWIKSTGSEGFRMGNSSFVFQYIKDSLSVPEYIPGDDLFTTGSYTAYVAESVKYMISTFQIICKEGDAEEIVPDKYNYLGEIKFRQEWANYDLFFRERDCEIVTPDFKTIETEFYLNNNLIFRKPGNTKGDKGMGIDKLLIGAKLDSIVENVNHVKVYMDFVKEGVTEIRQELQQDPPSDPGVTFGSPVRIGKILSNAGANILNGYSSWEYLTNGRIRMWYLWQRINLDGTKTNFFLSCTSADGLSGHWDTVDVENPYGNLLQGYGPTSSKKFKGNYYHIYNKPPFAQLEEKRFFKSVTGHTWAEYQTAKKWELGEDHNIFVINQGKPNEEMIMLVRPLMPGHPLSNGKRHISIMRTSDGIVWTDPVSLFVSTDANEQYYSMSACEVKENLYYGCLNVFNESTQTVKMRIMKSTDLMNWTLIENIALPGNVKQQYGAVSYNPYKKEIDILTLESENDHAGNGSALNRFYLALNKVKVNGI